MAEPLNATFFAFRRRERKGVLVSASLAFAVLAIVLTGLFGWLNWHAIVDYMNWAMSLSANAEKADPNNPFGAMMPPPSVMALGPAYFLFLVVYYLLLASYEAACLRWMIRGETDGIFGLALNADTLRVYFTYWVWWLLLIAFYFVVAIVGVGLAIGLGAAGGGDQGGAAGLGVFVAILVVLLLLLYFGVRFAPAAATSIARKRFAFFDAWKVTKGRFWALLGSFVLLFVIYIVGAFVLVGGLGAVIAGSVVSHVSGAEPATPADALAMFASPSVWGPLAALYAFAIVGGFIFYIALFGVNARAAQAALEEGKITAAQ